MITIETLKDEIERIKDIPKFHRMLEFSSMLTEYFESIEIKPIIVGGLSVEIYTRNDYHTNDIDFVLGKIQPGLNTKWIYKNGKRVVSH